MDDQLSRRAAIGAMGAIGTLAALPGPARSQDPVPIPRPPDIRLGQPPSPEDFPAQPPTPSHYHMPGVRGRMTGAKAAVAALQCEGVPCVYGIPGAQNNEFWDAMKTLGMPYLLVTHEGSASIMADACAGHGHRRRLRGCAGPGADERDDRHRRGAAR